MGWRANTWESKVLTSSLVWNDKWMRLNVTTSTILIIWNSKVIFRYWMHQFLINTSATALSIKLFNIKPFSLQGYQQFSTRLLFFKKKSLHTSLRNYIVNYHCFQKVEVERINKRTIFSASTPMYFPLSRTEQ